MIRVLHVIAGLNVGGANMMLLKLLSGMDCDRFSSAIVVLMDEGRLGEQIRSLGVQVIPLGMSQGAISMGGLGRLVGAARAFQPDLIQGWMYHGNAAALFSSYFLRHRPVLLWNIRHTIYEMEKEKRLTRWLIRLGARFSKNARAIIYNARISAVQHESLGYDPARTEIIPNGFDTRNFQPDPAAAKTIRAELGIPNGTPLIGTVGRFHPMKDQAGFIQAAADLAGTHPDAHFLLVGPGIDGRKTPLRSEAQRHGLSERIHFWGERRDVPAIMAALDIFTLPSAWGEGFPNVIGEAMACGVPCVVTDVGDAAEIVGGDGLVVPAGEAGRLAGAWRSLLAEGAAARAARGLAGRQRIEEQYSIEAIVSRYERLYTKAYESRG